MLLARCMSPFSIIFCAALFYISNAISRPLRQSFCHRSKMHIEVSARIPSQTCKICWRRWRMTSFGVILLRRDTDMSRLLRQVADWRGRVVHWLDATLREGSSTMPWFNDPKNFFVAHTSPVANDFGPQLSVICEVREDCEEETLNSSCSNAKTADYPSKGFGRMWLTI